MPGVKRRAPADLPALAEQLVAEPRQKANNLPVLLAALTPGYSEVRDGSAASRHARASTPRRPPPPSAAASHRLLLPGSACPACAALHRLQATPVLHSLRIFFIDAFDRGDLSAKPPSPDTEEGRSAEAVFSAWLHRQYCAYQGALLLLLGHPEADSRTQVGDCADNASNTRIFCADALTAASLVCSSAGGTHSKASSRPTALPPSPNPPSPARRCLPSWR
jgi:hypothetical protein